MTPRGGAWVRMCEIDARDALTLGDICVCRNVASWLGCPRVSWFTQLRAETVDPVPKGLLGHP